MVDLKLKEYATERQAEYIDALHQHGTVTAAAKALGVNVRTLQRAMRTAEQRAAKRGYAPAHDMIRTAAEGFHVKGVSTLYDADGNLRAQWVKTNEDRQEKADALREVANALADDVRGKAKTIRPPKLAHSDLMVSYPMGDPHIGLYSWHEETGSDFNLDMAEAQLVEATTRLVACAPAAEQALIVNVGDFFHSDTLDNKTRRSGHTLDVDTRWPKVLRVGARAMKSCIDAALAKHQKVRVINAIGNHDDQTSIALSVILDAFYSEEPRVEIDMSPARVHYHEFGSVLIGVTHGDTIKLPQLPLIMATDRPEAWARCPNRHWYTGHIHQQTAHDISGVTVESFRTLAAQDAWSASMGYRSGRDMRCIVHHRDCGEIERHRVDVRMLRAA